MSLIEFDCEDIQSCEGPCAEEVGEFEALSALEKNAILVFACEYTKFRTNALICRARNDKL